MDLPPVDLLLSPVGKPMVRVAEEQEYTDIPALIGALPALMEPGAATTTARAVNHLTEGFEYGVITDPDGFKSAYLAQLEQEADTEWQQGQPRLSDFGRPDFSDLAVPEISDGTLVFFADDKYLGIAYRVTMPFDTSVVDYQPIPTGN